MTQTTFHEALTDTELLAITLVQLEDDPAYTTEKVIGFHLELNARGLSSWWSATQELSDEQLLAITSRELCDLPVEVRTSFFRRLSRRHLLEAWEARHRTVQPALPEPYYR